MKVRVLLSAGAKTLPGLMAAFSALERPHPEASSFQPVPPPALPGPVQKPVEFWHPDWRDAGSEDEFVAEPWRHDWAKWSSTAMSVGTVASGALVWKPGGRWNLASRSSFKCGADSVYTFLEWLGPVIETWDDSRPVLVGYIDEYAPRPYLL